VSFVQSTVLSDLLGSDRLSRLKDIEIKSQPGKVLTLPELFNTFQDSIWTEVTEPKSKNVKISRWRRSLQRQYLEILGGMVLRKQDVPEDARTLAWYKIRQLDETKAKVSSDFGVY
jgi:hypothetical protein